MYVVILGRESCPYCDKAKALVASKDLPSKYIDIVSKGYSKEHLEVYTGTKVETVPQIFVDGKYVGGYTELSQYLQV